jgi:hypothetical protein
MLCVVINKHCYKVRAKVFLTDPNVQNGGRGIALLFLDLDIRRVVSTTPRLLYTREKPGTHCTGGWVSSRVGLGVCEKSHPTGVRSPDRQARSQSLHRLTYHGPSVFITEV